MNPSETFLWGFLGSVAVEIVTLLGFYYSRPVRFPARYRRIGFWITRFMLALLAGLLAIGYDIHQRILAFNIGAATPLLITFMAQRLRGGSPATEVLEPVDRKVAERPAPSDEPPERSPAGSHRHGPTSGSL